MANDPQGHRDGPPVLTSRRRRSNTFPPVILAGIFLVISAVALAWWFWFRPRETPDPGSGIGPDSVAASVGIGEEPFVPPPLDASDEVVRRLATEVVAHPRLAEWLITDDLIRRFVRAVVDLSRGSSPVPAMEMLIPPEPFSVQRSGDRLLVDPESYRRYDALAQVFVEMEVGDAVELYGRLFPLFQEAYLELGLADGDFQEVLGRAVRNLLSVEVPAGPLEVREAVGRYVYVEGGVEALTPAEKHLLRMGPENARQVREKVRAIAEALDLPLGDSSAGGGEDG